MEPYVTFIKKYNKLSNLINEKIQIRIKTTKDKDRGGYVNGFYLDYVYTKWFDLKFQFYSLMEENDPPNPEFCVAHSLSYKFEETDYSEMMMDTIGDIQKKANNLYISALVRRCEINCFLSGRNVVTVSYKVFCEKQNAKEVCLQLISTDIALFARSF